MSGDDVSLLWLGAALVAGIGIGIVIAYWFLPSDSGNRKLVRKNQELKAEQERYREDVQEHFAKTGELFEDLTKSYRKVYEHLASGAVSLGGGTEQPPELDLPDAKRLIEAAQGASAGSGASESTEKEPEEPVVRAEEAEPATTGEPGPQADLISEAASPSAEGVVAEEERLTAPAVTGHEPAGEPPTGEDADAEVRPRSEVAEKESIERPKDDDALASEAASEPGQEAPPEPRRTADISLDEEPEDRPRALH